MPGWVPLKTMSLQEKIRRAMQWQHNGELEKAKSHYLEILEADPRHPDALHLYGLACHQQGDHETAVHYIEQAVRLVPGQPVLRNNLGDALRRAGDLDGAARQLQHALDLNPSYAGAHLNLGSVHYDAGNHAAALGHAQKAVDLAPERADAWFNLGLSLLDHVRLEEAVAAFRQALAIKPEYVAAASSLLYTLNLLPGADTEQLAAEHCVVADHLYAAAADAPAPRMGRKPIRIGYVSGDFRAHAVNYFFEPVVSHHDSSRFEVFAYSDTERPDRVTDRLKRKCANWRDICSWSDDKLLQQIRADRIDVLVDLAGYTEHNRLAVFAARAAPCQLSFLGWPNTTGLSTMDYRVVDHVTAPAGEQVPGSERALRLPSGFACFRPPEHAPPVAPPPFHSREQVTFGSFHKLEKLNHAVIEVWAEVLRQTPGSRLLLARDDLDEWQQERLTALFEASGINAERLRMKQLQYSSGTFLELFAEIDIQLDTFPWSGHTMACMALWMGVPLVTLHGDGHAGRMVASVLESIGLEELIAFDRDSYLRISSQLAADPGRMTELRGGLRRAMSNSALCDEAGFTLGFEHAILGTLTRN